MFNISKNCTQIILWIALVCFTFSACTTRQDSHTKKDISRVVILGNSIVAHPPKEEIGWLHDWGMAASCAKCDFVHILQDSIKKIKPKADVQWGSIKGFELDYRNYDLSEAFLFRDADILIVKISENVQYDPKIEHDFLGRFDSLMHYLTPSGTTQIIIAEGFWPTPVNKWLKDYAQQKGYPHVPIEDLFASDKRNAAIGLFEHEGVANHPSDFGMKNIADRIWNVIKDFFQ